MSIKKQDKERFWANVKVVTKKGCWLWDGTLNYKGYGVFTYSGRSINAHRFSYKLHHGYVKRNKVIDHLCRNRKCVNPYHLEAVSPKENSRRGETGVTNRIKTHCPKGHIYGGDNLYVDPRGYRMCRKCRGISKVKYERSVLFA